MARRELKAEIAALGALPDDAIPLADAALLLAAMDSPQTDLAPYRAHLAGLAKDLSDAIGTEESLEKRLAYVNQVLYETHRYAGDIESYDDADNANLMRVIDRRLGLPVSLGILYIHAARAQGWTIAGLAFPGHFLVRIDDQAGRTVIDPFHCGQALEAGHLRDLIKQFLGADAELKPDHYAPVDNRAILLRLQNNIKSRALKQDNIDRAVEVLHRMVLFAPHAASAWFELGVLQARTGNLKRAIHALEQFLANDPPPPERHQGQALVEKLRTSLN